MSINCSEEDVPLLHLVPILTRMVRLADAHKKYGLTKSQAIVLIALKYRGSVSMGEVAQYMSSSKEQATRAVATLYDQGLIERFEQQDNRTHVYIRFSEAGRKFMKEFESQIREDILNKFKAKLTEDEINTLQTSLQTSIDLLNKVIS